LRGGLFGAGAVDIGAHDGGAFAGHADGGGTADARTSAGDECDSFGKACHWEAPAWDARESTRTVAVGRAQGVTAVVRAQRWSRASASSTMRATTTAAGSMRSTRPEASPAQFTEALRWARLPTNSCGCWPATRVRSSSV